MIKEHYPELFADEPEWAQRAEALCSAGPMSWSRSWSTCCGIEAVDAAYAGTVTYHDSCSGLRELGVKQQPRTLAAVGRRADT